MLVSRRIFSLAAPGFCLAAFVARGVEPASPPLSLTVPDGFVVEVVAAPPLVGHPMMAGFDERGRLFIAESAGFNLDEKALEAKRPNFIRMLEDTDSDGRFDKSTIFADKLMIPNGALWLDGALYVAEPPGIWRLEDTDGDGVADRRTHVATRVKSNGMSSTLHGPVLGPTGRLFWCGGQGGYTLDRNGQEPDHRIAPGVFTLRPDGSDNEIFSVGGQANPVEVTFSPEGEVFGTVAILDHTDGARHDALMHWVYGGVYNISPNDPNPLKRTGDFLPPLSHVGQVAPSGVMRYRGAQFGGEFRDNIFWAQFNTHKVVRTRLQRDGATFRSQDEDFLVSDSVDFHPTDVFEDADGSLLVIDTGGWFRHGCPTSQIARPDIKGAIYRIRRKGALPPADPRGLKMDWAKATPEELAARLDDPRPVVQDRAIATLAKTSAPALSALKQALRAGKTTEARRNAVWALARMDTPAARSVLRGVLTDNDASVRQCAVHSVGVTRDGKAVPSLLKLVVDDPQPAIRREAATALGRMQQAKAVSRLLAALGAPEDSFLQHSLIYALIQINQPSLTVAGLADADSRVRRGALLALSQMDNARLTREQVAPLLRANDLALQKAAFSVASRNANWIDDITAALRDWLREAKPSEELAAFLREAILAQAGSPPVQQAVAEALGWRETSPPMRLVLLDAIKRPSLKQYPAIWSSALERELQAGELEARLQAVAVVQERALKNFDPLLKQLARDEHEPVPLRLACLGALAPRLAPVDPALFALARQQLSPQQSPAARLTAARTLGALRLSDEQLIQLVERLAEIDALVLPTLLRSFARNTNEAVGLALVAACEKTPAAVNLSADELGRLFGKYPASVPSAARPLLQRLGANLEQQQIRLEELNELLKGGAAGHGKQIFFGQKAACATCHRVSGQGGLVGPNLTTIGEIRTGRDLLESVVYPSASIVQGFQAFTIETTDEQVHSGILLRQTPEAVWIRGTDLAEVRIETARIKSLQESALSIMPQGLDATLERDELRDLLAFLQSLKRLSASATDR